jgi:5'-nucleotidase
MHILLTNDDGIHAPGLLALAQAMRAFGQVSVLAPDRNWTASGHVKTLDRPLRVRETVLADDSPAYTSDGAPSDCVALALLGVLPSPVDLVVAGINPGENVGYDLTYSGTVAAAMEAVIWGLPGVAVSLQTPEDPPARLDFGPAASAAARIVERVIAETLPKGVILNVNVPYLPDDRIRGIQVTRQGLRIYNDRLVQRLDPRGKNYFWIGGDAPGGVAEDGTDYGAIMAGFISITPIQLDLTAHAYLEPLRSQIQNWEMR